MKAKNNPYTVLVVDDEEGLREMVAFAFELEGFTTLTASNGRTALDLINSHHVDVVVSDVNMPEGGGTDLLDSIRVHYPRLPLVVLTTGLLDLRLEDAYDRGAEALFLKPFELPALIACVRGLLSDVGDRDSGRQDIRVKTNLPVSLTAGAAGTVKGQTVNLSRGGVFLVLDGPYPASSSLVKLTLKAKNNRDGDIPLKGRVAWIMQNADSEPSGVGICFDPPTGHVKARYFEMLNDVKTRQQK